jgi:septal ring factor EnvC (AmiA/AmiB activator)
MILFCGNMASAADVTTAEQLANSYQKEKEKVIVADQSSRSIMSNIYEINQRMKNVSKRRNILNNRMMDVEGNVQILARQTAELSARLKKQRMQLSRRLRGMYMLGEESVVRLIFSSASAQDLDQSLKYLKIISDHDFSLIKSYQKNLTVLGKKKERLNKEVKKLLNLKERIQHQENLLSQNHSSKSQLLQKLQKQKDQALRKLTRYRDLASEEQLKEILNVSFFEQKGRLIGPVKAAPTMGYGPLINAKYSYRLSHKGHSYSLHKPQEVLSVFSGKAVFVGEIQGHGWTVVVDHGDHYYTVYAGADQVLIKENTEVKAAQPLARAAGRFYFEIRYFSDAIDPKQWLKET